VRGKVADAGEAKAGVEVGGGEAGKVSAKDR
jgi:hypothetical protein